MEPEEQPPRVQAEATLYLLLLQLPAAVEAVLLVQLPPQRMEELEVPVEVPQHYPMVLILQVLSDRARQVKEIMVVWGHTAHALMAAVVVALAVLAVLSAVLLPDPEAPAFRQPYPVHQ